MSKSSIRDTVLRSLSAIGATKEAKFYAELFAAQDAERFALIVIDPRCLKNPLLEALISNLRILSDLGLSPVLLVGALDDDRTSVKFQAQRLTKDLDQASVKTAKLNTASYQLIPEVRQKSRRGILSKKIIAAERYLRNLRACPISQNSGCLKPRRGRALPAIFGIKCAQIRLLFSGAHAWKIHLMSGIWARVTVCKSAAIGAFSGKAWRPQKCQARL